MHANRALPQEAASIPGDNAIMKHILFFNPSAPMFQTSWEVVLAFALRQRGHKVRFVACQGLPDCGMAPVHRTDHAAGCESCRYYTQTVLPQMGHSVEYIQAGLTEEERAEARDWSQGLADEELGTAVFRGWPLGEWTWPTAIGEWHAPDPDLSRPEIAQFFRRFLHSGALTALGMRHVFAKQQPDILVTLNGSNLIYRVAVELAKERGIRFLTYEFGWQDETLVFNAERLINDPEHYRQRWQEWKDAPLTREELRAVDTLLMQRRHGKNTANWAFSPPPQDSQEVRAALGLPPDIPMALLCTTSDCEGSMFAYRPPLTQREWIAATVAWFREHPEYLLVIRVHPNERDHAKVDDRALRFYEDLKAENIANVRVVLPGEPFSTYTLMDLASVGLGYGSTTGLEMACLGLPQVHSGIGFYRDGGFTHEITALADIAPVMEAVMQEPRSMETQRLAYRFMRHVYCGMCIPFSKVRVDKRDISAHLNFKSMAELAPGRDASLDRLTGYILGESELYPPPSPERLNVSPEAEDRFFAEKRLSALLDLARRHPDLTDPLIEAAAILCGLGLLNDAIAVYNAALQRDPNATEARSGLEACRSLSAAA